MEEFPYTRLTPFIFSHLRSPFSGASTNYLLKLAKQAQSVAFHDNRKRAYAELFGVQTLPTFSRDEGHKLNFIPIGDGEI